MASDDLRIAFMEADARLIATEGSPGPERDTAGAERRRARDAWMADVRQPLTTESFTLSRDADGIMLWCAGMFTTTPFTTPATTPQIEEVAKTIWKRLHPYPDLERGDAECEQAWSSARDAAMPHLRTLVREQLREL